MKDVIWQTSPQERLEFDIAFSRITSSFVGNYNGGQPIITWNSDERLPKIHENFLKHLPESARSSVMALIEKLR